MLTDCHVHSSFSSDSSTPVEIIIQKAISLGYKQFYITDHMDYDFIIEQDMDFLFSPEPYFQTMETLKRKYKDKIDVFFGIELGLQPTSSVENQIKKLLNSYSFDLIIGSTHLVKKTDPYQSAFWENKSEKDALLLYYEEIYENLQMFQTFHVLGHLDYAIRYSPSKGAFFSWDDYKDILDKILLHLIRQDIALEVNTGSLKYELKNQTPDPGIIKRFLDLGGQYISLGSDAHTLEHYAYEFPLMEKTLRSLGVKKYTTFQKGKPVLWEL